VGAVVRRRALMRLLRSLLVSSLIGYAAHAQQASQPVPPAAPVDDPHAVQPERPTVATHAGTVAPGWLEIETGIERDRFAPATVGYVAPTVVKVGLVDHVQLSIVGSVGHPAPGIIGLGDVAAGLKVRVLDDAPFIGDFAILPSVKLAAGSAASGTGTGTTDVSVLAISSHDFGRLSVDANVGYTRRSGDGSTVPTHATLWTISAGAPVMGGVGWTLECYGYPGTGGPTEQAPIVALLGGPTLLTRSWLAFDAGVIVPVAGRQPRALYAGAVYNVGQLWGARH
jgi:hypothetical protein